MRCVLQVASHLISGLSQAVAACAQAASAPYGMQSITAPSRIAVTKAAYAVRRPLPTHPTRITFLKHWHIAMHSTISWATPLPLQALMLL